MAELKAVHVNTSQSLSPGTETPPRKRNHSVVGTVLTGVVTLALAVVVAVGSVTAHFGRPDGTVASASELDKAYAGFYVGVGVSADDSAPDQNNAEPDTTDAHDADDPTGGFGDAPASLPDNDTVSLEVRESLVTIQISDGQACSFALQTDDSKLTLDGMEALYVKMASASPANFGFEITPYNATAYVNLCYLLRDFHDAYEQAKGDEYDAVLAESGGYDSTPDTNDIANYVQLIKVYQILTGSEPPNPGCLHHLANATGQVAA